MSLSILAQFIISNNAYFWISLSQSCKSCSMPQFVVTSSIPLCKSHIPKVTLPSGGDSPTPKNLLKLSSHNQHEGTKISLNTQTFLLFCYSLNPSMIQWIRSRNKLVANVHPRLTTEVNSFLCSELSQSHLQSLRGKRGHEALKTSGFCTGERSFYISSLL